MFKKKNKQQGRDTARVLQKRQQSYHYSSRRSNADRMTGRVVLEDAEMSSGHAGPQAGSKTRLGLHKFGRLPVLLSIGLLLVAAFYSLLLSTKVDIVFVNKQADSSTVSAVQTFAEKQLSSSLGTRLKLFFDKSSFSEQISSEFPEFTSVEPRIFIIRKNLQLRLTTSEPLLILTNGSNLYLVAENGRIMKDITNEKPNNLDTDGLPLVEDESGVNLEKGSVALTTDQVAFIRQIQAQTAAKKIKTRSMILRPGGGELYVRYAGTDYVVKYSFFEDARRSSGAFLATKKNLESRGVKPSSYIDVRVPERAYIK